MIVDTIPFAYKGMMRMWDGNLYPVQWVKIDDPAATVLPFAHPFGSMFNDANRPFDLGAVGEIPEWFAQRSTLKKPSWVCNHCYCGTVTFWQAGWPGGTPGVTLLDGWPTCCVATYATLGGGSGSADQVDGGIFAASSLGGGSGSADQVDGGIFAASSLGGGSGSFTDLDGPIQAASSLGGGSGSFGAVFSMLPYTGATISAAGTTQGTATNITDDFNFVNTSTSNTGVKLPNTPGMVFVKSNPTNSGLNTLLVYPTSGGKIATAPTNNPDSIANGTGKCYWSYDGSNWCVLTLTC